MVQLEDSQWTYPSLFWCNPPREEVEAHWSVASCGKAVGNRVGLSHTIDSCSTILHLGILQQLRSRQCNQDMLWRSPASTLCRRHTSAVENSVVVNEERGGSSCLQLEGVCARQRYPQLAVEPASDTQNIVSTLVLADVTP